MSEQPLTQIGATLCALVGPVTLILFIAYKIDEHLNSRRK